MSAPFIHLHVHSAYSLLRGANLLEDVILQAKKLELPALALTDVNGVYGAVKFWDLCRMMGRSPILGTEVRHVSGSAVLLVENARGWTSLCRILTALHLDADFHTVHALSADPDGLIVLSADPRVLDGLQEVLSPGCLYGILTPGRWRKRAAWLAEKGIPPVATADAYFVNPADYEIHRILRAIDLNTSLSRVPEHELAPPSAWFMPPAMMLKEFDSLPEALRHTVEIAERCALASPPWGETIFPLCEGMTQDEAYEKLRAMCLDRLPPRYPYDLAAARERLERELAIIREKEFASYFLIVRDIVRRASHPPAKAGLPAAAGWCGRGSGAASLVSYLLDITHVDPIRGNLMFERFISPGRKDPPDIDVDFAWDERDHILKYVFETYGSEGPCLLFPDDPAAAERARPPVGTSAAMIANHVTLQPRAAVREVAKVYGLTDDEIGAVTKRLARHPSYGGLGHWWESDVGLTDLIRREPRLRGARLADPWPEILRIADRILHLPRHLSVHPGGVVIVPGRIRDHVPVQMAAKGVVIIQWEKDQAEDAGLVKIDLLGNRSLAVIRDARAMIRENHGIETNGRAADPIDDPATQELIRTGNTMGVFYAESPAMRLLLKRANRGDMEHLVAISSIIRPAANDWTREWLARLHGKPWKPVHPLADGRFDPHNYGTPIYQEDAMVLAMAVGGFSVEEANGLRKLLSKKDAAYKMELYRKKFVEGARGNGVNDATIEYLWRMIDSFRGYSFCRPHGMSYCVVSFESAWLKAHHPAEFWAGVLSNGGGYYVGTVGYFSAARRDGLEILPPSVNLSAWRYRGRGKRIRIGLLQIKGLKQEAAEMLLDERRRNGPFRSLDDFLSRVAADPSDVILLIKAGAFDNVAGNLTRPEMIWRVLARAGANRSATAPLFPPSSRLSTADSRLPTPDSRLPILGSYDESTLLRHEVEVLGTLVSRHPLDLHREALARVPHIWARDIPKHVGRTITLIGWWITGKMAETKKGERMEFVSFEDTTAIYDCTLFPDVYARAAASLNRAVPYVIRGRVEEEWGAYTVTVSSVRPLVGPGS